MSKRKIEELSQPPAPAHENLNKDITDALAGLATVVKNQGQVAKYHVYLKAIHALKAYPTRVTSGAEAQKLDGIGKKIALKIQEILDTGRLKKLDVALSDDRTVAINLLAKIPGIGPKTAKRFVDEDHVRTLEDLRKLEHKLTHAQKVGLQHIEDLELKIPRSEVAAIEAMVKAEAIALDPRLRCEAVGSFRRGLPESGDIDILMTHPSFTEEAKKRDSKAGAALLEGLVGRLRERNLLIETLAMGAMQFMGMCRLPNEPGKPLNHVRHIDLKVFPVESFYCGLLHFTGSAEHNRQMSIVAQSKHFMLNEYSLIPIGATGVKGEPFQIESEEDIFAILGVPYRAPEERNM